MLQFVAVCCSVRHPRHPKAWQYVAVCCSVLQSVAVCSSVLQSVAVFCSVLQCVAEYCSVLQWLVSTNRLRRTMLQGVLSGLVQHTATHCNTLQHQLTKVCLSRAARAIKLLHCSTLQHTVTHCNTLQHTATHCNTLQHTATHKGVPAEGGSGYQTATLQYTATHCHSLQHTATPTNKGVPVKVGWG